MADDETQDTTPAKPARKRAPRKAKAAAPPPEATASVGEGALAEAALTGAAPAADAPAPAKRTRARKAPAVPPPATAPDTPEAPAAEAEAPAKPAKRTRARKAAPAPVDATDGAVAPPEAVATPTEPEAAPTGRRRKAPPPVVLFQPPVPTEEPAPRRRRPRIVLDPADAPPPADTDEDEAEETAAADEAADDAAEQAEGGEDGDGAGPRKRRRRGRRGRGRSRSGEEGAEGDEQAEPAPAAEPAAEAEPAAAEGEPDGEGGTTGTRRRRRRKRGGGEGVVETVEDGVPTVVKVRPAREPASEVQGIKGSTRLEAKRQRRRDGRDQGRRRPPIVTEAEFLARREAVDRIMLVRQSGDTSQIAVLEDGILVEHYVTRATATSYAGNVYLGRVQNVLPSMEAAFVDIGKGRNAVLYAGEVNYDASALEGRAPRIEQALKSGQQIVVQVTKDPIGHKGARLTSQVSLPGRYMVYVPEQSMTGISRKLPDIERARLKSLLKQLKPEGAGVIIRTAAEGASEEDLTADLRRLQAQWEVIEKKAKKESAPALLHGEPDLVIRVVRDNFNEDFARLVVEGDQDYELIEGYLSTLAPDLLPRLERHQGPKAIFDAYRVDEQIAKALDRKVSLPSGGSLVIDRTEAMTVVDVNTGKFTGKGGNLEETVTKNNLEAAEEIVRQLRLRDIGGIIVVDFIDMILESNRELVTRRLKECLGRDRTKHQVAELTSLGLLQMTRKRISQGLFEAFTETCPECNGRGVKVVPQFPGAPKEPKQKNGAPTPAQVAKRPKGEPQADAEPDPVAEPVEVAEPAEQVEPAAPVEAAEAAAPAAAPPPPPAEANGSGPDGASYEDLTPPEWRFAAAPE
ncbi:MAG TPA: Rne/Rng family ribonuclease [Mycobacteriales bacterium]|jgi:ribonuclease E|nr:Rne/Rng family ribonuclease [Mycobacteriales bacterium]